MIARLRAECHRLGLKDISISSNQARLGPDHLKTSEAMRLRRLARDAIYKEDSKQLVVPIKRGVDPATFLVGFLRRPAPCRGRRLGSHAVTRRALALLAAPPPSSRSPRAPRSTPALRPR